MSMEKPIIEERKDSCRLLADKRFLLVTQSEHLPIYKVAMDLMMHIE